MGLTRYTIRERNHIEPCGYCGMPLAFGDSAIEDTRSNRIFCSKDCADCRFDLRLASGKRVDHHYHAEGDARTIR